MTTKKTTRASKPAPRKAAIKSIAKRPAPPPTTATSSKADIIVDLLGKAGGASMADLIKATAWQPHSVRGFLSGVLKKKRGLNIVADRSSGETRYRLGKEAK